jgi:2-keto-4-pentenoate hydratase/2-oxohepta-3-ene-1,7-dioic acid hydratase in catechol pathway
MKLASFRASGRDTWGLIENDSAIDLGAQLPALPSLKSALGSDPARLREAAQRAARHPLQSIEWLPVIPDPPKILCVGLNYDMHVKETGRTTERYPTIFARYSNSQTAHGTDILRPRVSTRLDYEGELAVIIGTAGRYISGEDCWNHIAGYAIYNDASVRDWQRHTHQYTPGKNFPATGAFGPWMVTRDEMGAIGPQRLETRVNGTVLQSAALSEMLFGIPQIIEYCSAFTRLEPGDVIATGTPGGVGSRREPPIWLVPGDRVEVSIDGIGTLRNGVRDEPGAPL